MKKWLRGTNAVVFSLAVIGIFIVLNVIVGSSEQFRWDLTGNQKFTLSEQTTTVLKNLKQPVVAKIFIVGEDSYSKKVMDLLRSYDRESTKFSYQIINPEKEPLAARNYEVTMPTIVFEVGEKSEKVTYQDIFGESAEDQFIGEQQFTRALLKLSGEQAKTIYVLTGHKELDDEATAAFQADLQSEGYTVKKLNLLREKTVPADADLVAVLGPLNDWSADEKKKLDNYMKGNGRLLLTLDFENEIVEQPNLNAFLKQYGVTNRTGVVVQLESNPTGSPYVIVPKYEEHKITEKLKADEVPLVFAKTVALTDQGNQTKFRLSPLLSSDQQAYLKTDRSIFEQSEISTELLARTEKDVAGPLKLGYAIENEAGIRKMVVVANSMFLTTQFYSQYGNRDFALNSIGWLTENDSKISIRPVSQSLVTEELSFGRMLLITVGLLAVLPLAFLLTGILIWWRRRKG